MIYISKLLPQFVYPLGLIGGLIIIALLLQRKPRLQRAILIIALLVLFISGNRWVAMGLSRSLEWQYLPQENIPVADVIVVLGGGTNPAEYPRSTIEINGAGDRVIYAAKLYHQGKANYLLLSGGRIDWSPSNTTPADEMAIILEQLGVPLESMWLETESRNTYENALYANEILAEKGLKKIILVTSASHMPRTVLLFEEQGFVVIPAPTDYKVTQSNWQGLKAASIPVQILNLFPNTESLNSVTNVMKEYIGILVYKFRGMIYN
jgi:uncharacterized SAM-binding protein YcdF (DUF218 family)